MSDAFYPVPESSHPDIPEEQDDLILRVIAAVIGRRNKQDAKFGLQNHHPERWLAILGEEFGEVAKEVTEMSFSVTDCPTVVRLKEIADPRSPEEIAAYNNEWRERLYKFEDELIDTAAVAVAAVQTVRRIRAEHGISNG
jgi:hypothetical protein